MIKLFTTLAFLVVSLSSNATVMYGSIGNFDVLNDTGLPAHGFEIEYEGIPSTNVGYSWDWSRYGVAKVIEVPATATTPLKSILRYDAKYVNGAWSSTTAAATFPWMVTGAHQCTNPASVDGCEHFVNGGFSSTFATPPVSYHWLVESSPGVLVRADAPNSPIHPAPPAINIPVIQPPVVVNNVAAIVAIMPAPKEAVEPAPLQWGTPHWMKVIKTKTHNANPVDIAKLINEDKNVDNVPDWQDGAVAEVEAEWYLVQTPPVADPANKKGKQVGKAENINANEKVTRKYEFYKYNGGALSFDYETHEAMCDAADVNGMGTQASVGVTQWDPAILDTYTLQYDCTADKVVGDYIGANMIGFELVAPLTAIEMINDGQMTKPYVARSLVSGGNTPYTVTTGGMFPLGLNIDPVTGILTGTPTESGVFTFTVDTTDTPMVDPVTALLVPATTITKTYTISITDANGQMPAVPTPAISTQMLDNGVEGGLYQMQLLETSGTAPFVWTSTVLPTGLTLTDSGALTGTPAVGTAGITTPSITVTDKNGKSDAKVFTLNIAPAPPVAIACSGNGEVINGVTARLGPIVTFDGTIINSAYVTTPNNNVAVPQLGVVYTLNAPIAKGNLITYTGSYGQAMGPNGSPMWCVPTAVTVNPAPVIGPVCTATETLINNVCVPDPICTANELLTNHVCVADPVCPVTSTLTNHICVPDPICAANELLTNHVCVADPVCPVGSTITNHVCVVNPPVCAAPSTIVNGVCTAPVVAPASCVKPAGAKSFVAHAKITAVGQGTITIGTKVVSIPTCATVVYKGHATTFGIGFDAEVKNGYTLNGINYGSSLIIDDGH